MARRRELSNAPRRSARRAGLPPLDYTGAFSDSFTANPLSGQSDLPPPAYDDVISGGYPTRSRRSSDARRGELNNDRSSPYDDGQPGATGTLGNPFNSQGAADFGGSPFPPLRNRRRSDAPSPSPQAAHRSISTATAAGSFGLPGALGLPPLPPLNSSSSGRQETNQAKPCPCGNSKFDAIAYCQTCGGNFHFSCVDSAGLRRFPYKCSVCDTLEGPFAGSSTVHPGGSSAGSFGQNFGRSAGGSGRGTGLPAPSPFAFAPVSTSTLGEGRSGMSRATGGVLGSGQRGVGLSDGFGEPVVPLRRGPTYPSMTMAYSPTSQARNLEENNLARMRAGSAIFPDGVMDRPTRNPPARDPAPPEVAAPPRRGGFASMTMPNSPGAQHRNLESHVGFSADTVRRNLPPSYRGPLNETGPSM